MDADDSRELLDVLYRQATYPEYQVRFRWRPNSTAFWENRSCQHYSVSGYFPQVRRVERVTVIGDTPFDHSSKEPPNIPERPYQGILKAWSDS